MRFGLLLPHFGSAASVSLIRESAQRAEELGFDSLWARDHLVYQPHGMEDPNPTFYEGFATLAYAAALTRRVSLGTAAAIPSRSPLQLAQLVAGVTELSGRQFTLGLGAGFRDSEFVTTSLSGTTLRERATEVVPELIDIVRTAWSGPVAHDGRYYSTPSVELHPSPRLQPEIWYGGTSPLSLRMAIAHADGWMPGRITHRALARRMRSVAESGESPSEGFSLAVIPLVSVGETTAEALAHVDVASVLRYANDHRWLIPPESGRFKTPDDLSGLLLTGTPEIVVEELHRYSQGGVTDVIFDLRLHPDGYMDQLAFVGEAVLPHIQAATRD